MMVRRTFLSAVIGGLLAAPLVVEALVAQAQQQTVRIYRAGLLASFDPEAYVGDFREALRDAGYVEGQDLRLEVRWSDRYERLPGLAAELVTFRPDVLVAWTPPAALAARNATRTIPIVFSFVNEAFALNLVASLARPGGHITGLSNIVIELTPKVLELVKKVRPTASRVQVLWNPVNPGHPLGVQLSHDAAEALHMSALPAEVRGPDDLDTVLGGLVRKQMDALLPLPDGMFTTHRARIIRAAINTRIPLVHFERLWVVDGALISYGANLRDMVRRTAVQVDKILKGAKPADLPVERPTNFELVINLKTAKALGLTIPPSLLQRADQVIE